MTISRMSDSGLDSVYELTKKQDPFIFFILSRTWNKNVVGYTAKFKDNEGVDIDLKSPVNKYWIMLEDDPTGKKLEKVSYYEAYNAYGFNVSSCDSDGAIGHLSATSKFSIRCDFKNYNAYMTYLDSEIRIVRIHAIVCKDEYIGLFPKVNSLQIFTDGGRMIEISI